MDNNTLGNRSLGRDNNLNLVRLVAALMVMYMHSFALCTNAQQQDLMYTLTFHKALSGQVGVDIFFIISGFLIYRSYDRSNNVFKYLKARFLRIWPLLALFVLVSALVLGPMFSVLDRGTYFSGHETGRVDTYLLNLLFISGANRLPGVFSFHINQSANGSIWTLQHEVICYLLVLAMVPLFRKHKRAIFAFIAASAALYFYMKYSNSADYLPTNFLVNFGRLTWEFEIGVMYYLYRDKIIMSWKYALLSLVGLVAAVYFLDFEIAFTIFGAYIILFVGFGYWKISEFYNKVGDISYGVYIFSFFVQQRVIDVMGNAPDGYLVVMDPYVNLGVSILIVVPLAFISWHLFEKQLLKLK
ncbi:Peptidoglycan/LPS O-acetylase OafA/YrhL, contains acyltransferase and SGNH-hydrolase domains [Pseudobutyrivibrio sp. NOR37]|uniref:Acyltransferase n=1 Tax=Pseudobutyrivibrio xylanivorans TaxID=185007 RepID=A0A6M0LIY5_PSEXY|nr:MULTISPECIES: acyltransferase [Pseudobutyrivibrio]NEX02414.1 acyltransferase [Pseudobutyrivibrio xylanivorans]SFR79009.1 Peptidoglycan/LPS O-acetylase OafA/YrhL, contains acyltransferase and SGNH-hydrolase domains [Pseudobutyrivibrio sp. NOR37]